MLGCGSMIRQEFCLGPECALSSYACFLIALNGGSLKYYVKKIAYKKVVIIYQTGEPGNK